MSHRRNAVVSDRRQFLAHLGVSASTLPFVMNLPSVAKASMSARRKQRLVIMFSPNGVVPWEFWPDEQGRDFAIKSILEPLSAYRDKMLILHGVDDKIRGDGDSHMRGMGCLLTGIELYPGNIQGGSHTPAGWASGLSIDQEIKRHLQSQDETQTRFGSLEFGVVVPDRADTWTRMVYAGPNKPIAPIDDPKQMFEKLYGSRQNEAVLGSILDDVRDDLDRLGRAVSAEDRKILADHTELVREMEQQLAQRSGGTSIDHLVPKIDPSIKESNDNLPAIAKMQIDLMVSSFLADFTRVATLQITNSVGNAKMRWLGIEESHHELSHEPDKNEEAQKKLVKINQWYCQQLAYLVQRLAQTPEPAADGSMLDHTTIVWTNELGKGNSHTLNDIPFVLVGGGLGFNMGRAIKYNHVPHNRLLMSLAHAMGHPIEQFGNPEYCKDGPLPDLL
jgi:hypothetical protein